MHHGYRLLAVLTFGLICVGGVVTSTGAGMTVPDWPNSYGYNMFLFPPSRWVGGIFHEHTHRLIASVVGLVSLVLAMVAWGREGRGAARVAAFVLLPLPLSLIGLGHADFLTPAQQTAFCVGLASFALIAAAVCAWRGWREPESLRWWAACLLGLVTVQGILGGLRVTQMMDQIGIVHAGLAQLFFLGVCAMMLRTSREWHAGGARDDGTLARWARGVLWTTALVYAVVVLAACMRHAHLGLSVTDFPMANGRLAPDTSPAAMETLNASRAHAGQPPTTPTQVWLHVVHRTLGMLAALGVLWLWREAATIRMLPGWVRAMSTCWAGLVLMQILLGIWVITSNKAADIATVHVAIGTLVLATGWLMWLGARRALAPRLNGAAS